MVLLNDIYIGCGHIKAKFSQQFEKIALKVKTFASAQQLEKHNLPPKSFQLKPDDLLTSIITTTE